ncbi:MAG: 3-keto-5-aminohexanoate cleavage protein [Thermomicrobiales bacterium]
MDPISPTDLSKPVIISAALTGSSPTKAQNPAVPVTEAEIVEAALACADAGAAIVHIHVRDADGMATGDPERYVTIKRLMEESGSDVILNFSTSGGIGRATDETRIAAVALRPEIASFDCGSLNFGATVFLNTPAFLDKLAAGMIEHSVLPEIECFEPGHVASALRLIDAGKLRTPPWFQFVLGVPGGSPATVKQLLNMLEMIPLGTNWSVCGIGRGQLPLGVAGMAMGGHVRTGLEDNLHYHKGQPAHSNAQLVARLVRIAAELGRPVATPDIARSILNLPPRRSPLPSSSPLPVRGRGGRG